MEYKTGNMKLLNEVKNTKNPKYITIGLSKEFQFEWERTFPYEEKVNFINTYYTENGINFCDYILDLFKIFEAEYLIFCEFTSSPINKKNFMSKIEEKDIRKIIKNYVFSTSITDMYFKICGLEYKVLDTIKKLKENSDYKITLINEWFHLLLIWLLEQEEKYFKITDSYSMKIKILEEKAKKTKKLLENVTDGIFFVLDNLNSDDILNFLKRYNNIAKVIQEMSDEIEKKIVK